MDNMKGYHAPKLFNSFLNSALIIYVGLLPFSFDPELEYNIVWQALIVIYFFLGICVVTKKVANPFVSSQVSRGTYQTVGSTETDMNKALIAIKRTRSVTNPLHPRLNWAWETQTSAPQEYQHLSSRKQHDKMTLFGPQQLQSARWKEW